MLSAICYVCKVKAYTVSLFHHTQGAIGPNGSAYLANKLLEFIGEKKAFVYLNFIRDVTTLSTAL